MADGARRRGGKGLEKRGDRVDLHEWRAAEWMGWVGRWQLVVLVLGGLLIDRDTDGMGWAGIRVRTTATATTM